MMYRRLLAFTLLFLLPLAVSAEVISDGIVNFEPIAQDSPINEENLSIEALPVQEAIVYKSSVPLPEEESFGEELLATAEDHPVIAVVAVLGSSVTSLLIILEI